jgi:hypothetical protein
MTDTTRVPGPSSPFDGLSAKIIAVVVIGVLVAIVKPWGSGEPAPHTAASRPPPTAEPSPSAPPGDTAHRVYDPEVFGIYEPLPRWELWPAGYLTAFGFAMRIDSAPTQTPGPIRSGAPPSSAPPGDGNPPEPAWPAAITVGSASHLSMIGINTPLGFDVAEIKLWRVIDDQTVSDVPTLELLSPWPSHFTVVALAAGEGTDAAESWPAGHYRLSLRIEPGDIERVIDVLVDQPAAPSVAPAEASPVP